MDALRVEIPTSRQCSAACARKRFMAEAVREAHIHAAEIVALSVANLWKCVDDFPAVQRSSTCHLRCYPRQIIRIVSRS
jgi:hypothetical protein